MSLPTALRSALTGNTALSAITGDRVYYLRFPQDDTRPAVIYRTLGVVNETTHGGTSVLLEPEVRLVLRSESLASLEAMRQAVVDQFIAPEIALAGYGAAHCQINDLGAEFDDKLRVYHYYITLNLQMRTN